LAHREKKEPAMRRLIAALVLASLALPAAAQSLIPFPRLLAGIEAGGRQVVVGAQYTANGWQIYACPQASLVCQLLLVDQRSGSVLGSRNTAVGFLPPAGAKPASAVAANVQALSSGAVSSMFFNNNRWNVTVVQGGVNTVFAVDPYSAGVTGCTGPLCP
jgi:hypothetical protein